MLECVIFAEIERLNSVPFLYEMIFGLWFGITCFHIPINF